LKNSFTLFIYPGTMKMNSKIRLPATVVLAASFFILMFAPYLHIAGVVCPHGSGCANSSMESAIHTDECSSSLKESHDSEQVASTCLICQLLTSCFCLNQVETASTENYFASAEIIINEDSPFCKRITTSNPPTGPPAA